MERSIARRLDVLLALQHAGDGLLETVHTVATGEASQIPLPIVLSVRGTLLRGIVATPEHTAKELDAALRRVLTTAPITGNDDPERARATLLEAFDGLFMDMASDASMHRQEASNRLTQLDEEDDEIELIPGRVIDQVTDEDFDLLRTLFAGTPIIDLKNAELLTLSTGWEPVGAVRVREAAIDAWWVAPFDAAGEKMQ